MQLNDNFLLIKENCVPLIHSTKITEHKLVQITICNVEYTSNRAFYLKPTADVNDVWLWHTFWFNRYYTVRINFAYLRFDIWILCIWGHDNQIFLFDFLSWKWNSIKFLFIRWGELGEELGMFITLVNIKQEFLWKRNIEITVKWCLFDLSQNFSLLFLTCSFKRRS